MWNLNLLPVNQPRSLLEIHHSQPGWQRKQHTFLSQLPKKEPLPGSPLPFFYTLSKFSFPLSGPPLRPAFTISPYWCPILVV